MKNLTAAAISVAIMGVAPASFAQSGAMTGSPNTAAPGSLSQGGTNPGPAVPGGSAGGMGGTGTDAWTGRPSTGDGSMATTHSHPRKGTASKAHNRAKAKPRASSHTSGSDGGLPNGTSVQ